MALSIFLIIAAWIGGIILSVWVVIWNAQAIADHGLSFWPVFWILAVIASISGGASATT